MKGFEHIHVKLQQFIHRFYVNELIKGMILFFTIGLLYFIFTLFIEHLLWLKPLARTMLFWLFILVETLLLVTYILIPIFKISGFKKGISQFEASKIIGRYFPEVNDKLLNMLQLKDMRQNLELIEASIEQKSKELQPIPFKRAIDFSKNGKYLKYAVIPIAIWFLVSITGNSTIFNDSFSRVVHYNTAYKAPAPFSFRVLNESFNALEGAPFTLQIETVGNTVPEDVKIFFLNENYYIENKGPAKFEYTFSSIEAPVIFYLEANNVVSKNYQINSIPTPVITNFKMVMNYPNYTGKQNEVIQNTGNAIVPQGTKIAWQMETHQTENIAFKSIGEEPIKFTQNTPNYFSYSKQLFKSANYIITTSNQQLKNYESLNFTIGVVLDEHPNIIVRSDIDSISSGPAQFIGQVSDDYGVHRLNLVYYDKNNPKQLKTHAIEIVKSSFTDFYYVFPEGISIEEGMAYEMYFEVFDNDAVNGSKKKESQKFSYYNKTEEELKADLLNKQKETISTISKTLEKAQLSNSEVEKFKNELQKKAEVNWNDSKKIEQFIKRQSQYQEMFQNQTKQLEQNLNEQDESETLKEKKEDLLKRIEETKKLAEQERMMEELTKLAEKIEKEGLVEKLKEMVKRNKQNEQSLERILELIKRFYVEQKVNQIAEKLKKLAEEEEQLSKENKEGNTVEKQEEINKEFANVKKELNDLKKENSDLKRPMKLPNDIDKLNDIDDALDKALEELKKQQGNAAKTQGTAAKKMKELSKSMEQSMLAMEGEAIDENIDDLRKIVENLIEFSFQQEDLLEKFSDADYGHPEYPKNLKQQHVLKEYFEHIDDSLYVVSLRLVKMSNQIQKEVGDTYYYMNESLTNFSENRVEQGISNQHFVITSVNNLANQLSDLLESLMNASASMGKGKGGQPKFSLPDIIQKQGELAQKMKEGMMKENRNGEKSKENERENNEKMNDDLYEIYKKQQQLRELLQEKMGDKNGEGKDGSDDVIKQMEALEKEMIEKGFTKDVIEKMQQLNYELLKLEKATLEQGEDKKRTSETNRQSFEKRRIDKLKLQNQYFKYNEILNRQSLPLRTIYKKKVQEYFLNEQ